MDNDRPAPRDADLPPGFDNSNPYSDIDTNKLPNWWKDNIDLFSNHGMRPYKPPRFNDSSLVPKVISNLEAKYNIIIHLRSKAQRLEKNWIITVNHKDVARVSRHRDGSGYSVYDISSLEFEGVITEYLGES